MYCRKCGKQIADDSKFCSSCGTRIEESSVAPVQPAKTVVVADQPVKKAEITAPDNRITRTIRDILSSKLVLILAIIISVSAAYNLVSNSVDFSNAISGSFYATDIDDLIDNLDSYDDIFENTIPFVGQNASVLTLIGIWVLFAKAADKDRPFKRGGLTVLKASGIVNIVFLSIALLSIVSMLSMHADSSYYYYNQATENKVALLIWALSISLLIVFYSFFIAAASRVKRALASGVPGKKLPMFLVIMSFFIMAVNVVAASASAVVLNFDFCIRTLLSAALYALFAALVLRYRTVMKKISSLTDE